MEEEKTKFDILFEDSKKDLEEIKAKSENVISIKESIDTLTKDQSFIKCVQALLDYLIKAKDMEKEEENKICFQLGYEAREKEERAEAEEINKKE